MEGTLSKTGGKRGGPIKRITVDTRSARGRLKLSLGKGGDLRRTGRIGRETLLDMFSCAKKDGKKTLKNYITRKSRKRGERGKYGGGDERIRQKGTAWRREGEQRRGARSSREVIR